MSSGPVTDQHLLSKFLVSAFNPDEFLALLHTRPETEVLVSNLSNKQSAQFFLDAALLLTRHGLINKEFFSLLQSVRPARKAEIEALQQAICTSPQDAPPYRLMACHKAEAEVEIRLQIPFGDFTSEKATELVAALRNLAGNPNIIIVHIRAGSTIVRLWCALNDLDLIIGHESRAELKRFNITSAKIYRHQDPSEPPPAPTSAMGRPPHLPRTSPEARSVILHKIPLTIHLDSTSADLTCDVPGINVQRPPGQLILTLKPPSDGKHHVYSYTITPPPSTADRIYYISALWGPHIENLVTWPQTMGVATSPAFELGTHGTSHYISVVVLAEPRIGLADSDNTARGVIAPPIAITGRRHVKTDFEGGDDED